MAFKAPPHCPRLQGLLASRVENNVGLGLDEPLASGAMRVYCKFSLRPFGPPPGWYRESAPFSAYLLT